MARRRFEERNTRSLFTLAGGKSFALTLPIEVVRKWGWDNKQELILTVDEKKQRVIIESSKAKEVKK